MEHRVSEEFEDERARPEATEHNGSGVKQVGTAAPAVACRGMCDLQNHIQHPARTLGCSINSNLATNAAAALAEHTVLSVCNLRSCMACSCICMHGSAI